MVPMKFVESFLGDILRLLPAVAMILGRDSADVMKVH